MDCSDEESVRKPLETTAEREEAKEAWQQLQGKKPPSYLQGFLSALARIIDA